MTAVTLDATLGRFALTPQTRSDVTRICRDAARSLGADGLGVALALPGTLRVQFGASDRTAWLLEQAELTAGDGPGTRVCQTGVVVRTRDVTAAEETRWPVLSRHLRSARTPVAVRAVVALPITDGTHTFGSVTVHSADPAGLDGADGTVLTRVCTEAAAAALRAHPDDPDPTTESWQLICRAVREVAAAQGVDVSRATQNLRAVALRDQISLTDAARAQVGRPRASRESWSRHEGIALPP